RQDRRAGNHVRRRRPGDGNDHRTAQLSQTSTEGTTRMSDPKTNEQTQAAVERIKQLTDRMVAAARTAGAGVLEANEKALRGLAEFTPRDPARAAFEWVQALAQVHATFIEETSSAYLAAARQARAQVPAAVADQAVVKRIRELNERILA